MTKRRLWRLLTLLLAFSLFAAACGSDDDDDDASDDDVDTQTTAAPDDDEDMDDSDTSDSDTSDSDTSDSATSDSATDGSSDGELLSVEEIFANAADNRARIIADLTEGINSGEYGVNGDVLSGPGGFEIDLSTCPADWNNVNGITDSEIRIGYTTPQSGALAAYGNSALGWENYFNWVNENDPIQVDGSDRDLLLLVKDDSYEPSKTIEFVDELIESENVLAVSTLGSPNTFAVRDKLNAECIPQPFVFTGHQAWGDPVNFPWTTGLQLDYLSEAKFWGEWIRDNVSDLPVSVGALVADNDFGLAYELGFEEWVEENSDVVSDFIAIRSATSAPTVTNEITTIAASSPEVFISMTAGAPCVRVIQEVDASGLLDELEAAFTSSVCKSISAYMAPAGESAGDWWIVGGGAKDTTDPQYINEPFISFVNDNLDAAGLDSGVGLYATGYQFGYPYVESLRIASELPGGLTRTNLILAVRSTDIYHPLFFDGVKFGANGAEDAYFIEGTDYSQFNFENQTWNVVGDVIDFSGETPNCVFDRDTNLCS